MKVILLAALSVDGYIARHTTEAALWTSKEDKKFFVEKTKEIGVMIMGRTTYETIGRPLPGRRIIVLSARPGTDIPGSVEYRHGTPQEILGQLAQEGVESVVIAGGARVYSDYLHANVVHELWITTEALLFGGGIPLTTALPADLQLEIKEQRQLSSKTTLTCYTTAIWPASFPSGSSSTKPLV
jgi:dihydrofolate reductase